MPTRNDQLKSILQLLGSSVTKAEVQTAFKQVIKYVQDIKKSNDQEWSLIRSAFSMLEGKVKDGKDATITEIKKQASLEIKKALKQQEDGMRFIYDKVARLEDGEDGKDGHTPTEQELLALITPLIPKVENGKDAQVDINAIVQEVLSKMPKQAGGRIGWGAHPLTIAQSGSVKEKVARYINFTGATVTRSPDGIVTVAISGGGSAPQIPTGVVNGSNATFVAATTPTIVFTEGGHFTNGNGVTITGLNIVFDANLQPQKWIYYI